MKLAVAQSRPFPGDIARNIDLHLELVELAVGQGCALLTFPELSLTGYEPSRAVELALPATDQRLGAFQEISDRGSIAVAVGLPLPADAGIQIGMVIFQPGQPVQTYAKQHLHVDELPFFVPGQANTMLNIGGFKVAPAICYESLLPEFIQEVAGRQADVYLASVAKTATGMDKAHAIFGRASRQHQMTILLSNCIGPNDDFVAGGKSAIWDEKGRLLGQFEGSQTGILIWNRENNSCETFTV